MTAGQGRNRSALILYGSESGNAHDVAEELSLITERLHFQTHVSKLDAIEPSSLSEYSIVVVSISTTGQGDIPANAHRFWRSLLKRKLPPDYLRNVQFTTFGLGDSSYPKFNWAARKLHKRLTQLGANELYPRGEGDEQHEEGLDGSFVPWSTDLRRHLLDIFPLNEGISVIPDDVLLEPKWTLALAENPSDGTSSAITNAEYHDQNIDRYDVVTPSTSRQSPKDQAHQKDIRFTVKLEKNNRLTPATHWQDVRHIQLESKAALVYDPGDVLTIYPKNRPEDVDSFLDKMDWKSIADQTLKFVQNKLTSTRDIHPEPPISILPECKGITLRGLLTDYLDLTAIPRRSFFSLIAHFTQDQSHKERLLEFTKPEYVDELYDYTTRPRRSISEVLQEFASVRIPWQWAANVLPDLRGRQFSIASGGQLKTTGLGNSSFDLLVAIVKYKTVIKRVREGVCTRYLAALCPGSEMTVTLQKGGLGITRANARRPVIMIGPGTGLAPMRSLIWERLLWVEEHEAQTQWYRNGNGTPNGFHGIGESVLFFGSRNKGSDYFYQHEWEDLKGKMPLQVYTAFSRDQKEKVYVQDLIKEQASLVYRLLHDSGGIVYVCGSSGKMPQAVRVALTEVFKLCGGMPQGTAEEYLQIMEKEGRYKQETW